MASSRRKRRGTEKLTADVHARIVSYVRAGAYKRHAAQAVGVHYKTLERWLERGLTAGDEPYATFARELAEAQGLDVIRDVTAVTKAAAGGDWKAAAWKLERKYPTMFGLTTRHELRHELHVQKGVEQVLDAVRQYMSEAAYGELVEAIARIQGVDAQQADDDEG